MGPLCKRERCTMVEPILAAEAKPDDAHRLARCLRELGLEFHLVRSAEQALRLARKVVLGGAVVAAELTLGEVPIAEYFARLPATRMVVAIGPPGSWQMRQRLRMAGANVFLGRPITVAALRKALGVSSASEGASPPPRFMGTRMPPGRVKPARGASFAGLPPGPSNQANRGNEELNAR